MMSIPDLLLFSSLCGAIFAPIIALRMKLGLNPIAKLIDEENKTAGEDPFLYYLFLQLFIGVLGWPAVVSLFYAVSLILSKENYESFLYLN